MITNHHEEASEKTELARKMKKGDREARALMISRSGLRIQGHPFLVKPISLPELIKGIEENLPVRAAF